MTRKKTAPRTPLTALTPLAALLVLLASSPALAHFGMLIPENSVVPQTDKNLGLTLSFSHPFEMVGMVMEMPESFAVYHDGEKQDLLPTLKETEVMGKKAWQTEYMTKRPGMYVFAFTPQPYPEPAEDNYIIHYTKTMVSGFDEGEGWDEPVGLPVEIVPLTRPWGNYAGNVFQGRVLRHGKPVPGVRVEVEYYNRDGAVKAPSDAFITQEVLADENGVFTFACPHSGWWGFAALMDGEEKIEGKDVELGAVLWTEMK